ncbi:hypothetical protein CORC01_12650, partial [Colletotrichum orchidophilum]
CWRHRRRLLPRRFLSSWQQDSFQQCGLDNAERRGPSISYPVSGDAGMVSELTTKFRQLWILKNVFNVEFHRKARERALPKSGYQSPTGSPQHDMSLTGGYCEGSLEKGTKAHTSDSPLTNEGR